MHLSACCGFSCEGAAAPYAPTNFIAHAALPCNVVSALSSTAKCMFPSFCRASVQSDISFSQRRSLRVCVLCCGAGVSDASARRHRGDAPDSSERARAPGAATDETRHVLSVHWRFSLAFLRHVALSVSRRDRLRIVGVSANAEDDNCRERALDAGMDELLCKPVKWTALLACLRDCEDAAQS
eukprot:1586523-Pleurochrysis_carterae.AAC.1